MVRQAAQVAGVERLQQVERFAAAHLADEDAIGPVPQGGAHEVGDRDGRERRLLAERRLRAPRLEPNAGSACRGESPRSPRSRRCGRSLGMPAASAFSSVVLPVPVPPEMRMFRWHATACAS